MHALIAALIAVIMLGTAFWAGKQVGHAEGVIEGLDEAEAILREFKFKIQVTEESKEKGNE